MGRSGDATSKSVNATRARKRVEADTASTSLKRAKNGSAFTRCEACNKDVAVALISMHDCGLDAKIRMNLEAQVVEMLNDPVVKKATEKKKPSTGKEQSAKKVKKQKDPSKPKKPPTAFFLFMEEFRVTFKAANPDNKKVSVVAKEGGEKWRSMTEEEKKPYTERAAELKEDYLNALQTPIDAENEKAERESNDDDDEGDKVEVVADEEGSPDEVEVVADDE
ncbi:high mobility group B protein 7 [Cynara cardunculus var. scolymus]|uniref:high mobility group B protein 7 n=1 Tax=Cynara cardunculus var. scolymus TaxID=59895 RepID=UPI000D62A70A|nr:high mobility group B protein 7 [Cynara cardunculus var. scolymus]